MQYRVIYAFNDRTDGNLLYNVGDVYPRAGIHPAEGRIAELSGSDNKLHRQLIEEINAKNEDLLITKKRRSRK